MNVMVSVPKTRRFLLIVWALLVLSGFGAEFSRHVLGTTDSGLVEFLSLSGEANLPTWASSAVLLVCAIELALITFVKRRQQAPFAGHWAFLALAFLYISMDETAEIHESASDWFDLNGPFFFGWVIPAGVIVTVIGLCYLKFLWHLPRRSGLQFVLAGATFVGGALGVEMVLGCWTDMAGKDNFAYGFIDLIQEGMELLGATLFLCSLAEYLAGEAVQLEFLGCGLASRSATIERTVLPVVVRHRTSRPRSKWAVAGFLAALFLIGLTVFVFDSQRRVRAFSDRLIKEQISDSQDEDEDDETAEEDAENQFEQLQWAEVISTVTLPAASDPPSSTLNRPFVADGFQTSKEVTASDAEFWSFQPLKRVAPPAVKNRAWARNPIDQFILARLEDAGLGPNPEAERRVLGRRMWFDLIGLPPGPDDIQTFVADGSPQADEQLVERLLSHLGFGERWGRVWLDLARYADSNGYEEDELRPQAYPYRDFVIWAMNHDLPYNQFARWQVAGDELNPHNPLAVAATGFLAAAPFNTFMPQETERHDELDDMVSTLNAAMLGLTAGCSRCHDHPYDPIPSRDYYGLVAIFRETRRQDSYLVADRGQSYRRWADPVDERRREINDILKARIKEDNIRKLDDFNDQEKDVLRQPLNPNNKEQQRLLSLCERCLLITDNDISDDMQPLPQDRQRYQQLMKEVDKLEPFVPTQPPVGLTLTGSTVARTHVLDGGDLNRKQDEVGPGFITAVTRGRPIWDEQTWKTWEVSASSNEPPRPRTALAYWLTDVEQGPGALLARVLVNRLWQQHFGQGLVSTSSDFGTQGERPTHPELLDWLAGELIDHDWSLKHVHRLIVSSATYRQSTAISDAKAGIDPENKLLWRHRPQRLTAEMVRDSMLAAGGNLNLELYGPGFQIPIPEEAVFNTLDDVEDTWPSDDDDDRVALWRRGVYAMQKRTIPVPFMQLFDAPGANFSCGRRSVTTVPTQILTLWNAPFGRQQAERTADRVVELAEAESGVDLDLSQLVQHLYLVTLGRPATPEETQLAVNFLEQDPDAEPTDQLPELCHVMLMTNEFLYVD